MADPAWAAMSMSIGDWLTYIAVAVVLAVLIVTVVERFGARAGARGRAISRQRRRPLVSGLDPGPETTAPRWGGVLPRRPYDWAIDGEAISSHSPGPCEPTLGREEKCPKIGIRA